MCCSPPPSNSAWPSSWIAGERRATPVSLLPQAQAELDALVEAELRAAKERSAALVRQLAS
jgi:hypothetical protein